MIDEPFRVIVLCVATKVYAPLANRDIYKKKPDARLDTHCIKTGVQLCPRHMKKIFLRFLWWDLNLCKPCLEV